MCLCAVGLLPLCCRIQLEMVGLLQHLPHWWDHGSSIMLLRHLCMEMINLLNSALCSSACFVFVMRTATTPRSLKHFTAAGVGAIGELNEPAAQRHCWRNLWEPSLKLNYPQEALRPYLIFIIMPTRRGLALFTIFIKYYINAAFFPHIFEILTGKCPLKRRGL